MSYSPGEAADRPASLPPWERAAATPPAAPVEELVWLLDPVGGAVRSIGGPCTSIWGRPAEALQALPLAWLDDVHAGDRARVEGAVRERPPDRLLELEYRLVRPDGRLRWLRDRFIPLPEHGQVATLIRITRDATAEVEAADRLRLRSAALDAAAEAFVVTTVEGVIEWVNPAFTALTGYRPEEVVGRTPAVLRSGRVAPERYRELWGTILAGRTWRGEVQNRRADGSIYAEQMTIAPVFGAAGDITHFVAVKHDVSAERRLRDELEQARRVEGLGQLAASVAHDLNNVLVPVFAGLPALAALPLDEGAREALEGIGEAALRARGLVRQVLRFARGGSATQLPLEIGPFLARAARASRAVLDGTACLETRFDGPFGHLLADQLELEQVVTNLCINARDASGPGGPCTIELWARERDLSASEADAARLAPGRYLELGVADRGAGIPPQLLERIFEPFFSTKPPGCGTGLGLATVRRIARAHQGEVLVASEEGQGSVFRVLLPLVPPPAPDAAVPPSAS